MNEWMNEWMDEWMNEWMNEWNSFHSFTHSILNVGDQSCLVKVCLSVQVRSWWWWWWWRWWWRWWWVEHQRQYHHHHHHHQWLNVESNKCNDPLLTNRSDKSIQMRLFGHFSLSHSWILGYFLHSEFIFNSFQLKSIRTTNQYTVNQLV